MTPNWSLLAPHRPVDSGGDQYVPPPSNIGEAVARWVLASGAPVLLGGPTGVGKSTELAQVAALLRRDRAVCLIQLDRFENMRRLDPERMLFRVAKVVKQLGEDVVYALPSADDAGLGARASAANLGALFVDLGSPKEKAPLPPADLALSAIRTLARLFKRRVALLIDGLEKVPEAAQARALFDALSPLAEETDLVVVAPWNLAFGPQANEPLVRQGERFFFVRAPEVEPGEAAPGVLFLLQLLKQRLVFGEPRMAPLGFVNLARDAAISSGGLPRVFLQLLADAATYALMKNGGEWPERSDLADAITDHQEGMRRGLLPGDLQLIRAADNTQGLELPIDAKVRLLAHGLLLERQTPRGVVLQPHPLLRPLLSEG
ncbi:ATP-binding protein [Myxococcota bacterium]|nr:ATP-binding protein [Myxococcota bacterium]